MITIDFKFTSELWEYQGKGSWHFVTLPKEISADIKAFTKHNQRGFRSVRVSVAVGEAVWLTSLFPDKKSECYFLPIKASIRKSEGLSKGDDVRVNLEVYV